MAKLFNRAKMTTSTTGSGTVTMSGAAGGFQSFADAGVSDGDVVQYLIEEGSAWEIGTGTYSATGTSLTRSPSESSNSGAAVSLGGAAYVAITAVAADLNRLQSAGTDIVTVSASGAAVTGNITVTGTVDGVDIATRDGVLTSTTTTANAALPKAGGTMTGAITFAAGQTFDGRDVSADGTKLDGIESGADVTDTTNVVAALTAGTNVTIAADGTISSTDTNTTYSAGAGLNLIGTTFSLQSDLRGEANYIGYSTSDYIYVAATAIDFRLDGNLDMRLENDGDLHVDGNVVAYSTTTSDPRLKENIQPVTNGLDKIMQLNGYTFDYKADGVSSAGVLSTEIKEVLPSAVKQSKLSLKLGDDNDTEYDVVQYDQLTALFIEAIKDLKTEIDELKAKLGDK